MLSLLVLSLLLVFLLRSGPIWRASMRVALSLFLPLCIVNSKHDLLLLLLLLLLLQPCELCLLSMSRSFDVLFLCFFLVPLLALQPACWACFAGWAARRFHPLAYRPLAVVLAFARSLSSSALGKPKVARMGCDVMLQVASAGQKQSAAAAAGRRLLFLSTRPEHGTRERTFLNPERPGAVWITLLRLRLPLMLRTRLARQVRGLVV